MKESRAPEKVTFGQPRTQAKDKLGAPAKLGRAFRPTSAEQARGSRKKPSTVRGERAARRVSVDTPR